MAGLAGAGGRDRPSRAPLVFFLCAEVWCVAVAVRSGEGGAASAYHALMRLAMSWMCAAMGGLPLRRATAAASTDVPGGMPSGAGHGAHAGHGGHSGHGGASSSLDWAGMLNWACAVGFAAAAAYWVFRAAATRRRSDASPYPGALSQVALAAGMAIMFAVML